MFKRLSLMLIVTFFGVMGLFLGGSFLLQHHASNETLTKFLQLHLLGFIFWRYCLIGLLLIFWPQLINAIGTRKRWDKDTLVYLMKSRWYLLGFIVLFELLIAHNLLAAFIKWIYQVL